MTTVNYDQMFQSLIDGINMSKIHVANQPHLLDELTRIEIRLYQSSDKFMETFALFKSGEPFPKHRIFDFFDVRDDLATFMAKVLGEQDDHMPDV